MLKQILNPAPLSILKQTHTHTQKKKKNIHSPQFESALWHLLRPESPTKTSENQNEAAALRLPQLRLGELLAPGGLCALWAPWQQGAKETLL